MTTKTITGKEFSEKVTQAFHEAHYEGILISINPTDESDKEGHTLSIAINANNRAAFYMFANLFRELLAKDSLSLVVKTAMLAALAHESGATKGVEPEAMAKIIVDRAKSDAQASSPTSEAAKPGKLH